MTRCVLAPLFGALVWMSVVSAQCQDAALRLSDEQLAVGEWYQVTVEKFGDKRPAQGRLLKVTDEWLVLGTLCCGANDETTGPAGWIDVPIVGPVFRSRVRRPEYFKYYQWIPRANASIDSRERIPADRGKDPFEGDDPIFGEQLEVIYRDDGNVERHEMARVKDGQLAIVRDVSEVQIDNSSRLAQLPLIGGVFLRERIVARKVEKAIDRADVICVVMHVPVTAAEAGVVSLQE